MPRQFILRPCRAEMKVDYLSSRLCPAGLICLALENAISPPLKGYCSGNHVFTSGIGYDEQLVLLHCFIISKNAPTS